MSDLVYYFDVSKTGKDVYGTKDLGILTNTQAVQESINNILMTEPGQKIMDPEFGVPLYRYLFTQIDEQTAVLIQTDIEYALDKFEKRIQNVIVDVILDEDNNAYNINIFYEIIMTAQPQEIKITLDKIR